MVMDKNNKNQPPYKKLLTYKYSVVILDLTKEFVKKFLAGREKLRTREQMVQAARSGKQNIVEGASQGTSLKGYIKLCGVARETVNIMIDLVTRTNYLLDQQIRSLKEKHRTEGGFTEKLYRARKEYRGY